MLGEPSNRENKNKISRAPTVRQIEDIASGKLYDSVNGVLLDWTEGSKQDRVEALKEGRDLTHAAEGRYMWYSELEKAGLLGVRSGLNFSVIGNNDSQTDKAETLKSILSSLDRGEVSYTVFLNGAHFTAAKVSMVDNKPIIEVFDGANLSSDINGITQNDMQRVMINAITKNAITKKHGQPEVQNKSVFVQNDDNCCQSSVAWLVKSCCQDNNIDVPAHLKMLIPDINPKISNENENDRHAILTLAAKGRGEEYYKYRLEMFANMEKSIQNNLRKSSGEETIAGPDLLDDIRNNDFSDALQEFNTQESSKKASNYKNALDEDLQNGGNESFNKLVLEQYKSKKEGRDRATLALKRYLFSSQDPRVADENMSEGIITDQKDIKLLLDSNIRNDTKAKILQNTLDNGADQFFGGAIANAIVHLNGTTSILSKFTNLLYGNKSITYNASNVGVGTTTTQVKNNNLNTKKTANVIEYNPLHSILSSMTDGSNIVNTSSAMDPAIINQNNSSVTKSSTQDTAIDPYRIPTSDEAIFTPATHSPTSTTGNGDIDSKLLDNLLKLTGKSLTEDEKVNFSAEVYKSLEAGAFLGELGRVVLKETSLGKEEKESICAISEVNQYKSQKAIFSPESAQTVGPNANNHPITQASTPKAGDWDLDNDLLMAKIIHLSGNHDDTKTLNSIETLLKDKPIYFNPESIEILLKSGVKDEDKNRILNLSFENEGKFSPESTTSVRHSTASQNVTYTHNTLSAQPSIPRAVNNSMRTNGNDWGREINDKLMANILNLKYHPNDPDTLVRICDLLGKTAYLNEEGRNYLLENPKIAGGIANYILEQSSVNKDRYSPEATTSKGHSTANTNNTNNSSYDVRPASTVASRTGGYSSVDSSSVSNAVSGQQQNCIWTNFINEKKDKKDKKDKNIELDHNLSLLNNNPSEDKFSNAIIRINDLLDHGAYLSTEGIKTLNANKNLNDTDKDAILSRSKFNESTLSPPRR